MNRSSGLWNSRDWTALASDVGRVANLHVRNA
jgi:hypothetical protein